MIQGFDTKDTIHRLRKLENDSLDVASVGAGVNADFKTVAAAFAAGNRMILIKEGKQVAITGDIPAASGGAQITITAKDHGVVKDQHIVIEETDKDSGGIRLEGIFKIDSVTDSDNFKITLSGDNTGISGGITASGFVKFVVDGQLDFDNDRLELVTVGESKTNSIWTNTTGDMITGNDVENKVFENIRFIPFSNFSVWRATTGGLKNITFKNNLFIGFLDGHKNWDISNHLIQIGAAGVTTSTQIRFIGNDKVGSESPGSGIGANGGFAFAECENIDFSHNYFERLNTFSAFNQLFFGQGCKSIIIANNRARAMGNAFIFTRDTGSELVMISNNTLTGENIASGIQIGKGSEGASIVGNTIKNWVSGINFTTNFGNATGNTVKDCTVQGIAATANPESQPRDTVITGNMVVNCVNNIDIIATSSNTINGLTVTGNTSVNATNGIVISSFAKVCVVGNTFQDNTTDINGSGAAGSVVANNVVT